MLHLVRYVRVFSKCINWMENVLSNDEEDEEKSERDFKSDGDKYSIENKE